MQTLLKRVSTELLETSGT